MNALNLTTAFLGLGLALLILVLMRRDHLQARHGVFWVSVAVIAGVLGAWPTLIDRLAVAVGISYSPALLLLLASIVLLVKALAADIQLTRIERQVRRLNQRLALVESSVDEKGSGR